MDRGGVEKWRLKLTSVEIGDEVVLNSCILYICCRVSGGGGGWGWCGEMGLKLKLRLRLAINTVKFGMMK